MVFTLVLLLALTSCGGNKKPPVEGGEGTDPVVTEPVEVKPTYAKTLFSNWQEYEIVYEDGAADIVSSTFVDFNIKLGEKYNFTPRANRTSLCPVKALPRERLRSL